MTTNCYHRRNSRDQKTLGGMMHCTSYEEAALHATHGLHVGCKAGRLFFANDKGEEVRVYLSVHPEHTPKGAEMQAELDRERNEQLEEAYAFAREHAYFSLF